MNADGRRLESVARSALLLAALACALSRSPDGAADSPRVDIAAASARQGDCVFVFVRPDAPPTAGECRWEGETYSLFPAGDGYRAILPVAPDAPVGPRELVVVLREPAGEVVRATRTVKVVKRDFGVQKLRMSKSTARLYTDRDAERERELIHGALARVSAEQLWRGPFAWPCKGRVSTGFGLARSVNGEIEYRHRGLDIAAAAGAPVVAAAAGVVSLVADDFKLHGKTIALDHGQGVSTLYLHLSKIHVKQGQRVVPGERIGAVGATGAATGPHLHWAVYVHDHAVEPHFWLDLPAECR